MSSMDYKFELTEAFMQAAVEYRDEHDNIESIWVSCSLKIQVGVLPWYKRIFSKTKFLFRLSLVDKKGNTMLKGPTLAMSKSYIECTSPDIIYHQHIGLSKNDDR
jgi:hypothetical protein